MYELKTKHLLQIKNHSNKNSNNNLNLYTEEIEPVLENKEEIISSKNENKEKNRINQYNFIKIDKKKKSVKNIEIFKMLKYLENKEDLKNKSKIFNSKNNVNITVKNKLKQSRISSVSKTDKDNESFNIIKLHTHKSFIVPNAKKKNSTHNINLVQKKKTLNTKRYTMAYKPTNKNNSNKNINQNLSPNINNRKTIFINIFKNKKFTQKSNNNNYLSSKSLNTFNSNQKMDSESRYSDDFGFSSVIRKNKIRIFNNNIIKDKYIGEDRRNKTKYFLNDPIIKKRDNLFKTIKKYSFIQSIASLLSILFCIIDIELYNNYSDLYIIENDIQYNEYYKIKNRKINSTENTFRILNLLSSFVCVIMTLFIYFTKLNFNKSEEKKLLSRKNNTQNINLLYELSNNHLKGQTNHSSKISKIKFVLRLLINIFFSPPSLNYCFKSSFYDILYIFPFQIFVLIFSSFKLYNVYRCIFYFIPSSGTLGKAICQKYKIRLNIKLMFKSYLLRNQFLFPFTILIVLSSLATILLHSVEKFSFDISLQGTTELNYTINNYNVTYHNLDTSLYLDTLWLYLSVLPHTAIGELIPKTPLGKILILIFHIIGFLFLCIIYLRINKLVQFSPNGIKAFAKLEKLFKPENKENKAADLIRSLFLIKKYYSIYNVDINKVKENYMDIKRKTFKNIDEIEKIMQKNILKMKNKKIIFLKAKFIFLAKFFTELKNFVDIYKISRKQPLGVDTIIQNTQDKMSKNINLLSQKIENLTCIDDICDRLKTNDNIMLKKIKKIKKNQEFIINYLIETLNNNYQKRKKNEILKLKIKSLFTNREGVRRSLTKKLPKFKSFDISEKMK